MKRRRKRRGNRQKGKKKIVGRQERGRRMGRKKMSSRQSQRGRTKRLNEKEGV